MNGNFEILSAVQEDVDQITEMEQSIFSVPWSRNLIEQEILEEAAVFLAAKAGDRVLGYVGGRQIIDEFYINNIAVLPEFRGYGIGRALMERIISVAREGKSAFITLEVRVSNRAARCLYESLGFRALGERKDFYQRPLENAVIYTLYFDPSEESNEHSRN